jgi:hypothetical protein
VPPRRPTINRTFFRLRPHGRAHAIETPLQFDDDLLSQSPALAADRSNREYSMR